MRRTLLLGGPGTGKTHRLLGVMRAAIASGASSDRIAFVTFTNAAEDEARARAAAEFGADRELPYFRTIHSLAFRELGLHRSDVLTEQHLAEFAPLIGELFTGDADPDAPAAGRNADPLLTLDHYARTTRRGLRGAWEDHGGEVDWHRLLRFSRAYATYKIERGLVDFTDMLGAYVDANLPPVPVDVAIVDEYQDLTKLQVDVVARAFGDVSELWVAGDDDQSIHRWAGAAEDQLLSLDYPREVLPESHRLPRAIFELSQRIAARIGRRFDKPTLPAPRAGSVEWLARVEDADLWSGTWLLLARTRGMLRDLAAEARHQGVAYAVKGRPAIDPDHVAAIRAHEALRAGRAVDAAGATAVLRAAGRRARELDEGADYSAADIGYDARSIWHDALAAIPLDDREYYLAVLRRGGRLTDAPRVRIETIHGAKGLEAENVLLLTDLTYRVQRGYEIDPDAEHRVFYVGATRASVNLFPVAPRGRYAYAL